MSSAPIAPVNIVNLALDLLKQEGATDIDTPRTPVEVIASRWYDMVRRSTLRLHPWNFACTRTTLARSSTAPSFGYTDAYNLPNNYIRLVSIGDDSIDEIRRRYEIENAQLIINNDGESINIRYIYDCTNVPRFDPLFIDVFVLRLALKMAPKFSISTSLKESIKADLKEILPASMAVDGQESPIKRIQVSKSLNRRRGIGRSSGNPNLIIFED